VDHSFQRSDVITFLTDFGTGGTYVAACEAVLARLAPAYRVLHLSHEVALGDIDWGAILLERVAPLCPPCLHLAVVDPGVGTDRRPLALLSGRGDILVGPDNGLLAPAADALGGVAETWLLEPAKIRAEAGLSTEPLSATFHGRDVFAPAAALLATGLPAARLATPADADALVRRLRPSSQDTAEGLVATVIEVDRFGNIGLSADFAEHPQAVPSVTIEVVEEHLPIWKARVVQTFGCLNPGELGVYCDSWGKIALALNGASAAELLAVGRGAKIRISPREDA
jgi:S-adenosylmethionine hydrolase